TVTMTSMPITTEVTEKRATGRPDRKGDDGTVATRAGPSARGKSSATGVDGDTVLAALDRDQLSRIFLFSPALSDNVKPSPTRARTQRASVRFRQVWRQLNVTTAPIKRCLAGHFPSEKRTSIRLIRTVPLGANAQRWHNPDVGEKVAKSHDFRVSVCAWQVLFVSAPAAASAGGPHGNEALAAGVGA